MKLGGMVLAGGRSQRMGTAKANLWFGPETMLQRIVRIVAEVASPVMVVAAANQILPVFSKDVVIARDSQPNGGPLEGMASGMRHFSNSDAVFVTGCDTPLIRPAFIHRVAQFLDQSHGAAVPVFNNLPQPLAGVYRPAVIATIDLMLASGQRRLLDLLDRIQVRRIDANEFCDVDSDLRSFCNVNTQSEYRAALVAAGFDDQNQC